MKQGKIVAIVFMFIMLMGTQKIMAVYPTLSHFLHHLSGDTFAIDFVFIVFSEFSWSHVV